MIFSHPDHRNKQIISRHHHLTIRKLLAEGWTDVTPPRSPKQIAHARVFQNLGSLHRTKACLRDIFRYEQGKLNPDQMKALNKAEIVIQQLIKKYQSPTT